MARLSGSVKWAQVGDAFYRRSSISHIWLSQFNNNYTIYWMVDGEQHLRTFPTLEEGTLDVKAKEGKDALEDAMQFAYFLAGDTPEVWE